MSGPPKMTGYGANLMWNRRVVGCYRFALDENRRYLNTKGRCISARNVLGVALKQLEEGSPEKVERLMWNINLSKPELREAIAALDKRIGELPEGYRDFDGLARDISDRRKAEDTRALKHRSAMGTARFR